MSGGVLVCPGRWAEQRECRGSSPGVSHLATPRPSGRVFAARLHVNVRLNRTLGGQSASFVHSPSSDDSNTEDPCEACEPLCKQYLRSHWTEPQLRGERSSPGRTCPTAGIGTSSEHWGRPHCVNRHRVEHQCPITSSSQLGMNWAWAATKARYFVNALRRRSSVSGRTSSASLIAFCTCFCSAVARERYCSAPNMHDESVLKTSSRLAASSGSRKNVKRSATL